MPYKARVTFNEIVEYFGSQAAIARALGIKPPSVSQWARDGVPELRQFQIERLTRGALRAAEQFSAKARDDARETERAA